MTTESNYRNFCSDYASLPSFDDIWYQVFGNESCLDEDLGTKADTVKETDSADSDNSLHRFNEENWICSSEIGTLKTYSTEIKCISMQNEQEQLFYDLDQRIADILTYPDLEVIYTDANRVQIVENSKHLETPLSQNVCNDQGPSDQMVQSQQFCETLQNCVNVSFCEADKWCAENLQSSEKTINELNSDLSSGTCEITPTLLTSLTCHICSKVFPKESIYRLHMKIKHKVLNRRNKD